MLLSDFDYDLPEALIARYPASERTGSRLLSMLADGSVEHRYFHDLLDYLQKGDLIIFNNTRVIPARLYGAKETGGRVELLIERLLDEYSALAHVHANRSLKVGAHFLLDDHTKVEVIGRDNALFELRFHSSDPLLSLLDRIGKIPLPPYLNRSDEQSDRERYQTVYAKHDGSVAAPTAGLHFDHALIERLKAKGIKTAYVTLHVGAGTFQPVRAETIEDHHMHAEWIEVPESLCEAVRQTREQGGRIVAVGTTTLRSLETASRSGSIQPYRGDTDIFIYPGFKFHCVDAMITNFHLPKSSLLMLVSAFIGREKMMELYQLAIAEKYRFYSYGDAMFIIRRSLVHEI